MDNGQWTMDNGQLPNLEVRGLEDRNFFVSCPGKSSVFKPE
jgi:hypothetical protein